MSATGRKKSTADGEVTAREDDNHYPTSPWATRVLLDHLGFDLRGKRVLECAAGDGAMVNVFADAGAIVDAVELNPERAEMIRASGKARQVVTGDFLNPDTRSHLEQVRGAERVNAPVAYDAVISNPPYGEKIEGKGYRDLALEFVVASQKIAPVVAMLLRLNWAGSIGRFAFHKANPADLVVLTNRPKFRVGSTGDATEYAWWIWRRGATVGTWTVHFSSEAPSRGRPKSKVVPIEAAAAE